MCINTEFLPSALEASELQIESQRRWKADLYLVSKNVESLELFFYLSCWLLLTSSENFNKIEKKVLL